jgi:hypothetical protein
MNIFRPVHLPAINSSVSQDKALKMDTPATVIPSVMAAVKTVKTAHSNYPLVRSEIVLPRPHHSKSMYDARKHREEPGSQIPAQRCPTLLVLSPNWMRRISGRCPPPGSGLQGRHGRLPQVQEVCHSWSKPRGLGRPSQFLDRN